MEVYFDVLPLDIAFVIRMSQNGTVRKSDSENSEAQMAIVSYRFYSSAVFGNIRNTSSKTNIERFLTNIY